MHYSISISLCLHGNVWTVCENPPGRVALALLGLALCPSRDASRPIHVTGTRSRPLLDALAAMILHALGCTQWRPPCMWPVAAPGSFASSLMRKWLPHSMNCVLHCAQATLGGATRGICCARPVRASAARAPLRLGRCSAAGAGNSTTSTIAPRNSSRLNSNCNDNDSSTSSSSTITTTSSSCCSSHTTTTSSRSSHTSSSSSGRSLVAPAPSASLAVAAAAALGLAAVAAAAGEAHAEPLGQLSSAALDAVKIPGKMCHVSAGILHLPATHPSKPVWMSVHPTLSPCLSPPCVWPVVSPCLTPRRTLCTRSLAHHRCHPYPSPSPLPPPPSCLNHLPPPA